MKKNILFVTDWPKQKGNGKALQALLDNYYSDKYEWTIWSCMPNDNYKFFRRWSSYLYGAIYILRNKKKYHSIFIWQQMIGYIMFEITRFIPIKIQNVIIYTYFNYKLNSNKKKILKNTLKKSKALIWPSTLMANDVKNDFPEFKNKIYFSLNPIMDVLKDDIPIQKELDNPFFRNGVYDAGSSQRDHEVVIRAFKNTNIPVTIVCRDNYVIKEKKITDNIRILRFSQVNSEQYYALAKQAFCVLNSVTHEESPCGQLLVAFAMNNSIPVISTDCYGVKDYLTNNVNGLLFKVGKSEEIRMAYEKLQSDKSFRSKLILNAKEKIRAMSPEFFIEKIIEIIENKN
jgi:glycosyltransferase involved in cell wall biosynthesis